LKVKGGEALTLVIPEPRPSDTLAQDIPLAIVYEDDALLVVDKPAGLVVHPAAGNFDGTMVNALLHHCAGRLSGIGGVARPGIVHRIDKDTSGLLVVAKTDPAHEALSRQFAAHTCRPALCRGGRGTCRCHRPGGSRRRWPARRPIARRWRSCRQRAAASTPSPIIAPSPDVARAQPRSNAGLKPAAPTRSAFTWPQSAMRYWGMPLMDGPRAALPRCCRNWGLPGRRFMRRHWGSFIRHPQEKLSFESALPTDIVELIGRLSSTNGS
jgi:23S rRNA pseudouridine1911/1915/1917 synthase